METPPQPGDSPLLIHYPGCSKCRSLGATLAERGADFRERLYREAPLTAAELEDLLERLDGPAADLVRFKDAAAGLDLTPESAPEALIEALVAHPELLQRPILVVGERAAFGRPNELALDLLPHSSNWTPLTP